MIARATNSASSRSAAQVPIRTDELAKPWTVSKHYRDRQLPQQLGWPYFPDAQRSGIFCGYEYCVGGNPHFLQCAPLLMVSRGSSHNYGHTNYWPLAVTLPMG